MRFSVIVPIYNVEKYLNKCIDSIMNQTYNDFELILVDDGSPDNCLSICNHYADTDNRIKVIHQENKGVSIARQNGVSIAKGEYLAFIDSDDWVEINFLSSMSFYGIICELSVRYKICIVFYLRW